MKFTYFLLPFLVYTDYFIHCKKHSEPDVQQCNANSDDLIRLHNWGGNFQFSTQNIQYPRTLVDLQRVVRRAKRLRVLGSRHSFNRIADSTDTIVSLLGLNKIVALDQTVPSVTVQAGITYTDLAPYLHAAGFALHNLPSMAEVTVAGALQTGTHGTGINNGNLATKLRSVQMVLANGSVAVFSQNDVELKAVAVGLGAFGVFTQVELCVEPTFNITTHVFLKMPIQKLYDHFDELQKMVYSVSLFNDFGDPNIWSHVWVRDRSDSKNSDLKSLSSLFGAKRAAAQVGPLDFLRSTYFVEQNKEQPWHEGITLYRIGLSGSDGDELQTEYFVPYINSVPALKAVLALYEQIRTRIFAMEVRSIRSDDLWMSATYKHSQVGDQETTIFTSIHFTWRPNVTAVDEVLPEIEKALAPFHPRPHWGKIFTLEPRKFLSRYPKLDAFKHLSDQLDPTGKFRNKFLEENVFLSNS